MEHRPPLPALVRAAILALLAASASCREARDSVRPAPEADALVAPDVATPPPEVACLRLSTCGQWGGCVAPRPQPVPFTPKGQRPITRGDWYRFDWLDRRDELGERTQVCVGDAGVCFEALQHVIPCLPYFNPVEPRYRCEVVEGACTSVPEGPRAE